MSDNKLKFTGGAITDKSFKKENLDNLDGDIDFINILTNDFADEVDSLEFYHDHDRVSYRFFLLVLISFINIFINKKFNKLKLTSDEIISLDKNLLEEKIMTLLCQIGKLRYYDSYFVNHIYDHNPIRYRIDIGFDNSNRKTTTHKELIYWFIMDEYNEFINNNNKELNLFYVIMSLIQE
jgi:hypothetical protein